MSHVVSGPGSSSRFDNGTRFHQLTHDYVAQCPTLAREFLELEGIHPSPEAISETAHRFLPQYLEHLAQFLRDAHPSVPEAARDEAFRSAITILLLDEHLGLAARVLEHPDLAVSRTVREDVRPLVEYSIISALQSENLADILPLGSALDPLFFHGEVYGEALTRAILSYVETDNVAKIGRLVETPVQIPDTVIFRTRSEVEESILRHVREGLPLREVYPLSEMFMLSDFFNDKPFLEAVRGNISTALSDRALVRACDWADECNEFKRLRRGLHAEATAAVRSAVSEYRYYATDERSRDNSRFLDSLNENIRRAVETFGLTKELVRGLPLPQSERRFYRVGHPPCRLVHPPSDRREE